MGFSLKPRLIAWNVCGSFLPVLPVRRKGHAGDWVCAQSRRMALRVSFFLSRKHSTRGMRGTFSSFLARAQSLKCGKGPVCAFLLLVGARTGPTNLKEVPTTTPRIFSIAGVSASLPLLLQGSALADDDNVQSAAVFYRESLNTAQISTSRNSGVEKNTIDVDGGSYAGCLLAITSS
jgi:hypothetical protein